MHIRSLFSRLPPIINAAMFLRKCQVLCNYRSYHRSSQPAFPALTSFPVKEWPEIFLWIESFLMTRILVPYYFDKDFAMADFVRGSKKAVEVVTDHISNNNLEALKGLVTDDVIREISFNLHKFTPLQQKQLKAVENDMVMVFPYQVGMLNQPRIPEKINKIEIEITMIYHVYTGLDEIKRDQLYVLGQSETFRNIMELPDYKNKVFVLCYRFIKDFNTEEDWTINALNHGKLKSYLI